MSFVWSDKYSVGIKDIDEQHKKLFGFVNQLESLNNQPELEARTVRRIIAFLGIYTKTHFSYEEDCMFKNQCPFYQENEDAHGKFLRFFKDIKKESEEEGITKELVNKLYTTAENWLINHIGRIDIHMRDCYGDA